MFFFQYKQEKDLLVKCLFFVLNMSNIISLLQIKYNMKHLNIPKLMIILREVN